MEAEKLGNPAPLGLAGFGMTTILLNIHNAGIFPLGSMILAMGLCYGGVAQIIAGILEFKKGNTFGLTAFASYGFFWWTLVFIIIFKDLPAVPVGFMGWYLFLWGVFTFFMWFGTWGKNRVLQYVFLSLTVLFWLLAIRDWSGNATVGIIAGWEGITCGASALYLAMAEVINETHGKSVLPIGQL
jgi:succinate-acetate transporter protein